MPPIITVRNDLPIYHWTRGVPVEDDAMSQLQEIAQLPIVHHHVAAMPDMHVGIGSTVGTVIATKKAIIPAAVGVDIGCGLIAVKTNYRANQLPDNLYNIRIGVESVVPVGKSSHADENVINETGKLSWQNLSSRYNTIISKIDERTKRYSIKNPFLQMGTLGGGNHFIELCLDENDDVWIMLHSGSRGVGNRLASFYINEAKERVERDNIYLPNKDLAYLEEGDSLFDEYIEALLWSQDYARQNRITMMASVILKLQEYLPGIDATEMAVNCHHNYSEKEDHYDKEVWVTRKGAVRAREGDYGIIPGSMGDKSYIVKGKGSKESFCSCSHGAGRVMSRTKAKQQISLEEHIDATKGIECRKDVGILDESPSAYKRIDSVMDAQTDLVEIVHTLKQIMNIKG